MLNVVNLTGLTYTNVLTDTRNVGADGEGEVDGREGGRKGGTDGRGRQTWSEGPE